MERENFYRFSGLLLNVGGRVLRHVFTFHHLQSKTISAFLSSDPTKLKNLLHFLGAKQRLKLFPPSGQTALIDNFDITLLYALFRNLDSTIPSYSSVWSRPSLTNHSFQADIGRITNIRNELFGHLNSASLDNSTFSAATSELTAIYNRLISPLPPSHSLVKDLQTMIDKELTGPLQSDMEDEMAKMREELEEWQRYDEGIKAAIAVMKADIQNTQRGLDDVQQDVKLLQTKSDAETARSRNAEVALSNEFSKLGDRVDVLEKGEKRRLLIDKMKQKRTFDEMAKVNRKIENLEKHIRPRLRNNDAESAKRRKNASNEEKTFVDKRQQQRIISSSQWTLGKHRAHADKHFVETQGYRDAKEILRQHRILIITGKSGQGKSYLSCHLMAKIIADSSNIKPLILSTSEEWKTLVDSSFTLGIIVDDMCGKVCLNEGELKKWTEVSAYMQYVIEKGKHVVILTIKSLFCEKILVAMQSCPLFSKEKILNLDDILQVEERVQFVNNYLEKFGLNDDEVLQLCQTREATVGFPQLCKVSDNINQKPKLLEFFSEPTEMIINQIKDIRQNDKMTYCCLAIVLLSKGKLNLQSIREFGEESKTKTNIVFSVFQLCGIPVIPFDVLRTLRYLQGLYLSLDESKEYYSFDHDSIEEAVFVSHSEFCPEQTLRECSLHLICKRYPINYDSKDIQRTMTDSALNLQPSIQEIMISRFMTALRGRIPMDFANVSEAIIWLCQAFRKSFFTECKEIPFLTDKDENPLLVHAANANNRDLVIELLNQLDHIYEDKRTEVAHILRKSAKASCAHQDTLLLEKICKKGCLDLTDLLSSSIQHGSINAIKFLLKSGANINYRSKRGENLLHTASLHGRLDIAILLHSKNPNLVNEFDDHNRSIGLCIAAGGSVEILEFLIPFGISLFDTDANGWNMLHYACWYEKKAMVEYIVTKYPEMLCSKAMEGLSILLCAAFGGNVCTFKTIYELMENSLNGNQSINENGITSIRCMIQTTRVQQILLLMSCLGGGLEMTIYIAEMNSNSMDEVDNSKETPADNAEMIKYLVKMFPTILEEDDNSNRTPAHYAVESGNVDVLKYLIEHGTDPLCINSEEETLLHRACIMGQLEMAKYLVDTYPYMVGEVDDSKNTPAHHAAESGKVGILKYLTKHGADPLSKNNEEETLLHSACINGQLEMTKYLVKKYSGMLYEVDDSMSTPAHHAAESGNVEVLEYLIKCGIDPFCKNSEEETLLHKACINGQLEMTKYLVKKYPGMLYEVDDDKSTPAHHAAEGDNVEVLNYLINRGIDPWCTTSEEETLLHRACINGDLKMTAYLAETYHDMIHKLDNIRRTPAHRAAESGNVEVLKYLINCGIDPWCRTSEEETLLHIACSNDQLEMTKYLVGKYPTMLDQLDISKRKPVHRAEESGKVVVFKYLIDRLSDPYVETLYVRETCTGRT